MSNCAFQSARSIFSNGDAIWINQLLPIRQNVCFGMATDVHFTDRSTAQLQVLLLEVI